MSRHEPASKAARDIYFGLADYEGAASEPTPFDEPVVKTPCENCPTLCIGRLCRNCLPSGPDDRRVRSSK